MEFEPLKADDLPMLYGWLGRPHVREFYHTNPLPEWEEMREDYLRRLAPEWPTKCFLSYVDGRPMGYVQTYRVADYPAFGALIGEVSGISLDLFIADPQDLGRGLGRLMLLKFVNELAFRLFDGEEICWVYHDKLNLRALRCSKAAGFHYVRDFAEAGSLKELLMKPKSSPGLCAR